MKYYLHQYLSKSGIFTKKNDIIDALHNGLIRIDDRVTKDKMFRINTNKHRIYYKNKEIKIENKNQYIILNKPTRYICHKLSENDKMLGKKSIFDIIKRSNKYNDEEINSLTSVGRLDEDTSGLLILTNDGIFNSKITEPKNSLKKTYEATLQNSLKENEKKRIEEGIEITLEDRNVYTKHICRPAKINITDSTNNIVEIEIDEGKKREVRRIFEAAKNKVLRLKRIKIGNLELKKLGLKEGEFKELDKETISNMIFS